MSKINFTTSVGRLVCGSLYEPKTQDMDGNPLVYKNGANAGQPRVEYYFALAIPKNGTAHWNQTEWGALIWNVGAAAFPNIVQSPTFAWKIADGDSLLPNTKGVKPADREGWAGCWIIHFTCAFASKILNRDGSKQIIETDAVNLGDYVQVFGDVSSNDSSVKPGVYINPIYVSFQGYGERIFSVKAPDATTVGFGKAPLPVGASLTPIGGGFNPAPITAAPSVLPPTAQPITPYPNILTPAPAAPTPPPVLKPARIMLPSANGLTYDDYIAAGWTDALLVQHGLMQA